VAIHSIYKDFIRFLDRLNENEDQWKAYQKYYLEPYKDFLLNYWQHFQGIGIEEIKERVERIKGRHYSNLKSLVAQENLEKIIENALIRCKEIIAPPYEPDIYLIVGFFSPEGFVIEFKSKPIIGIGLERFKDFNLLDIAFAHEYAHWLASCLNDYSNPKGTLGNKLLHEGLAFVFSKLAFPNKPLYKNLFLSRATLNWCIANEEYLLAIAKSKINSTVAASDLFKLDGQELGIPPRAGNYISYKLVGQYLSNQGREKLKQLLTLREISL
jgi:hypothetical protein